jgi:hypothetical protein
MTNNLDNRLKKAESAAQTRGEKNLIEVLGGALVITMNNTGLYRAANGKEYTREELDKLIAECEPRDDLTIINLGVVHWTPE